MLEKLKQLVLLKGEYLLYDFLNLYSKIEFITEGTAAVNKHKTLFINPKFLSDLSSDEQIFVLYHELLHIRYNHIEVEGLNHQLYNIACDIIINKQLTDIGYKMPINGCTYKKYNVPEYLKTSIAVYNFLLENNKDTEQHQQYVYISGEDLIEEGVKELDKILNSLEKQIDAKIDAKRNIKIDEALPFDITIKAEIGRLIKRDSVRNYRRPNRRISTNNLILPNYNSVLYVPKIHMYIDTSSSMEDIIDIIVSKLGAAQNYLKDFQPSYFGFNVETYQVDSLFDLKVGGGTQFDNVVGNPDLHIIITDGELDKSYLKTINNLLYFECKDGTNINRVKIKS